MPDLRSKIARVRVCVVISVHLVRRLRGGKILNRDLSLLRAREGGEIEVKKLTGTSTTLLVVVHETRLSHTEVFVCFTTLRQTYSMEIQRVQFAFKDSMIHIILQFTLLIATGYVLHRYTSREIHRQQLSLV